MGLIEQIYLIQQNKKIEELRQELWIKNKHKYLWEDNFWRKVFEYITKTWKKIIKLQLQNWQIITKK